MLGAALAIGACAKNPAEDRRRRTPIAPPGRRRLAVRRIRSQCRRQGFLREQIQRIEPDGAGDARTSRRAGCTQYAPYNFTIEGHADERGTREYNFALGARRAEAAKSYLVARGIPAARIHTISYGKERPVAVCNDISCWSQNRRAVTVLAGSQS